MGTTECQRTTKFSGCFGHGGSLSFIIFTAHAKIHCSLFSWTCHPAKTTASKKSSPQTPIIQNQRINICFSSTLPPWSNTSACHFPAVLSQTRNSKQGEKLTLDLCSLSRHVFKCISAVPKQYGSQKKSSLGGFGKNSPDANLKQRAMTLSSALFNKLSTLLNSNEPRPALWKSSWYIVKSSSACNYSCLRPSLECEPWH